MGVALVVVSSIVFLAVGELFMSFLLPSRYYVWPPNFKQTFRVQPKVIHGITSPSYLSINSFGFRGDPLSEDEKYRVLTVGASTTICVYLDDSKAWPYLVQERLNGELGPKTVWVGNAGRPGHSAPQHVLQVEKMLDQYPEIDAVIVFIGIADALLSLSATIDEPPVFDRSPDAALRAAFAVFPDWDAGAPWYARNVIGRAARLRKWHPIPLQRDGVVAMDEKGDFLKMMRSYRKAASTIRHELPDISAPVAAYTRNVQTIVDRVERMGRRLIFLTQPTLWKDEMPESELDLIWGGGTDFFHAERGKPHYSTGVLAEAMTIFNDVLLGVCRKRGVECLDLDVMVPKNAQVFYDDAHYTEYGSEIVAERVAEYLVKTEPLSQLRPQ
jgi:lysophospholipase L1-like esterase